MKLLLAYLLVFFLAPALGAVIVFLPRIALVMVSKAFGSPGQFNFIANVLEAFVVAWIALKVCDILGVNRSMWILIVLTAGHVVNDMRRLVPAGQRYMAQKQDAASTKLYERHLGQFAGHIIGFAVGAWRLL